MSAFAFYGLIVAATLLVWWFSTGLIVYLDGLPKGTFRWSFGITSGLAIAALFGLSSFSNETTVGSAALAFFCAILVWGWNEMAFLMGYITGPRPEACPSGAVGFSPSSRSSRRLSSSIPLCSSTILTSLSTSKAARARSCFADKVPSNRSSKQSSVTNI